MAGLIIVILILPQKFQQSDAARRKQRIGSYDDTDDCQKELRDRGKRRFRCNRDVISDPDGNHSKYGQQPFCLWLFFSLASAS